MVDSNSTRLNRIEAKLDQLTDAMISLARAEEKISAMMEDQHNMHERLNRFSSKLDDIDRKVEDNNKTIAIINKLFWAGVIAAIATLVGQYLT